MDFAFVLVCVCAMLHSTLSLPTRVANTHKDEIVMVEETSLYTDFGAESGTTFFILNNGASVATDNNISDGNTMNQQQHIDNESVLNATDSVLDDLIFLAAKMPMNLQQLQLPAAEYNHLHHPSIHEIDLLAAEDLSVSVSSCSSSCELHGAGAENDDSTDGAVPREIELQADDLLSPNSVRRNIDMRDFVALIPAEEMKAIVANYYCHDPEVQRAYAYLSGREFAEMRRRIILVPEISEFLRFLNDSGLDILGVFYMLTNLTSEIPGGQREMHVTTAEELLNRTQLNERNSYAAAATATMLPTTITTTNAAPEATPTAVADTTSTTTTTRENLNGLHGLVDSILDVLPQDQILTTFFDKLEANEHFSKLVENIGSPEFAKILHNMEKSVELRNFVFTLHNNGIYITRIVDSLKAYFFLGTI